MFAGIKRAARAIFIDDLRIRRDEDGVHLVFESGPPSSEPPLVRAQREAEERRQHLLRTIRAQLAELLAAHPALGGPAGTLGAVDQALAERGLPFLDTLPLPLLRRALHDFEAAVVDWSPEGLAYLRSRMAVALREREGREGPDAGDTSALPVVHEVALPGVVVQDADEAALLAAYSAAGATVDAQTS